MSDPKQILAAAKRILLIDWPSTTMVRTLVANGFTVFSYSPDKYSEATVTADPPTDLDGVNVIPPKDGTEKGYLVFRRLNAAPGNIDIVCVYRPAEELPGIIERHVFPLGARTLWLHPPNKSADAARIAKEHGLDFVEGSDIAEVAAQL